MLITHDEANVEISELDTDRRKVFVEKRTRGYYLPRFECETSYPVDLIKLILAAKGPGFLCDEIARDEAPDYVERSLRWSVLSFKPKEEFAGKTMLVVGCGSGASTVILARLFSDVDVIGVDADEELLTIAKARADHYKLDNLSFQLAPTSKDLPDRVKDVDFVMLTAVYEHLLPAERRSIMPQIWKALKPGGVLFLHETPFRYFPIETHTTNGLPLINFMPDRLTHLCARTFSKRNLANDDWNTLLRKGIRGGTISEIKKDLRGLSHQPVFLPPTGIDGVKDQIDLWYASSPKELYPRAKKVVRVGMKLIKTLTGVDMVPYLTLAIQKDAPLH
jgi:2-polyprenyl-3-methyl-5-hydroxy-6-metoxy-1,4-benzoquinol methylase